MGAGFHGGFGNGTKGAQQQSGAKQSVPKNDVQIKHIFSEKDGHLIDIHANRKLLTGLANDSSKFFGKDKYGNSCNAKLNSAAEKEVMNKFELYCMIFYILDAKLSETNDPQLRAFLSGANPFLFADIGSADPTVYACFCEAVTSQITIENSREIASGYIALLENEAITKAFASIDEAKWIECLKDYLSSEHKGSDLSA